MSLALYEMNFDCGRNGSLNGLFIEDKEKIAEVIGAEVHFGEVLGKHSDISGTIEERDLQILSEDAEKIDWLLGLMESFTISGYNPMAYLEEE